MKKNVINTIRFNIIENRIILRNCYSQFLEHRSLLADSMKCVEYFAAVNIVLKLFDIYS